MNRRITVLVPLLSLLVAACVGPQADSSENATVADKKAPSGKELEVRSVPSIAGELSVEKKPAKPVAPSPAMQKLVDVAKNDLAARLSIGESDIETMQAKFVTWPDSSAGCPQPGMQYMQVLTGGVRIVLRANKATYHYHSAGSRPPFLCKNPSPDIPQPHRDDRV